MGCWAESVCLLPVGFGLPRPDSASGGRLDWAVGDCCYLVAVGGVFDWDRQVGSDPRRVSRSLI